MEASNNTGVSTKIADLIGPSLVPLDWNERVIEIRRIRLRLCQELFGGDDNHAMFRGVFRDALAMLIEHFGFEDDVKCGAQAMIYAYSSDSRHRQAGLAWFSANPAAPLPVQGVGVWQAA